MRFGIPVIAMVVAFGPAAAFAVDAVSVRHTLRSESYELVRRDGAVTVAFPAGLTYRIGLKGGRIVFEPVSRPQPEAPSAGALPDGLISRGRGSIRAACLAAPTGRYGHGVLGDAIEAGSVVARLADGSTVRHDLSGEAVFEDRLARIVDMDGDGVDEILVVKSYLESGSALALLTPDSGALRIAAESASIGTAHRWLNPIGVGDFDGDGRIEAAAVVTPDASRRHLRAVTFATGRFRELVRWPIRQTLSGPVIAADLDGDGRDEIVCGDAAGTLAVVTLKP